MHLENIECRLKVFFAADDSRWTQCPSSGYPSTRDSVQKQVMLNALLKLTFILYFY